MRALGMFLALAAISALTALAACGGSSPDDPGADDFSDESVVATPTHFTNPVIAMFDRPPGVPMSEPASAPGQPTEGCPDPTALETRSGDVYIYCTSYTFRFGRHDGFPIFKSRSRSLAGPWKRVGSLIADSGDKRATWPSWVWNGDRKRDGDFWAPDVHQLPNGKFAASYSAPCGAARCVGIAWSDHPDRGWTHAEKPFISPAHEGIAYDGNLLVTSKGELYFYWVLAGHGVYGTKVSAKTNGELVLEGSPTLIADRALGQHGEGPYVIEHAGAYYEFYSTGSLLYGYHVGVRRGTSPLSRFDREDPNMVVSRNDRFVATGGNSVVKHAPTDSTGGTEFLVYHAIAVPHDGKGCPRKDPEYGRPVREVPASAGDANPHCRVQGERQAMIDPIEWKRDADGIEWPVLKNGTGTPSVGKTKMP